MIKLNQYNRDGANYQARAVLALLQRHEGLDSSYNRTTGSYDMETWVARWENCREQGYVVCLTDESRKKQLNIAFFEHRNSDSICAIKWEQSPTTNAPTIDNAIFGDIYKDKGDVSKRVSYGQVMEMADWIWLELEKFCAEWEKARVT